MTNIEIKKRLRIKAAVFQTLVHSFIFFDIKSTNATVCTIIEIRKMLTDGAINIHT